MTRPTRAELERAVQDIRDKHAPDSTVRCVAGVDTGSHIDQCLKRRTQGSFYCWAHERIAARLKRKEKVK